MNNPLVSGDIQKKIQWYIRAHGHSSIGGLNLLLAFFKYQEDTKIINMIERAIENFELFGEVKDLNLQQKLLKNSITDIVGYIDDYRIEDYKKNELYQVIEGVNKNLNIIKSIIEDPGYEEQFYLSKIFESTITELIKIYPNKLSGELIGKPDGNNRINITFQIIGKECKITLCGYEIQLLFYNLMTNSIDAINSNKNNGNINVKLNFMKDYVLIEIKNDGEQISEEQIKSMNKREYFSTKGQGHGKGMKIIFDILDKYKSSLFIKSNIENSIFTIKFPYKRESTTISLK